MQLLAFYIQKYSFIWFHKLLTLSWRTLNYSINSNSIQFFQFLNITYYFAILSQLEYTDKNSFMLKSLARVAALTYFNKFDGFLIYCDVNYLTSVLLIFITQIMPNTIVIQSQSLRSLWKRVQYRREYKIYDLIITMRWKNCTISNSIGNWTRWSLILD